MVPRAARGWDPHTSYHLDGSLHAKSYDNKVGSSQKRQPLTGTFRGTEHLGGYLGHDPKSVGAVCDPTAFSGVIEVPPGLLGPRDGVVVVDLVEPGYEPIPFAGRIAQREVFRDVLPWVLITIGSST